MHTKHLTVNVEGWPERMVRMVENFVQALARQLPDKQPANNDAQLPLWPGASTPPEKPCEHAPPS